ncbi:hypothetical protein [Paenilisteria rocourtiae]|uniref:Uncharacterized protein n=1 Tax=Listeria rocourtiae TaxID=647910 RepID=A0A4R6ZL59_9LIST|nr:hypothetical protein [Listeria rocourtiae]EUJ47570.1 hypothetical protein PROCOU_08307 [Listeria rocourtiae FSL F6-920]MBC1434970.1 hypothetical protein [Listeria rocourtiae]MBC1604784.1 hypothetical protein [Listeria rocourtiae]TDR53130.1 hypothetical protein DFP96_10554 [Listeria rocourtiae]
MASPSLQDYTTNYKILHDAQESLFPYTISRVESASSFSVLGNIATTTLGIIEEDGATIEYMGTHLGPLCRGFYFCIPGVFEFNGKAILLERTGYNGNLMIGNTNLNSAFNPDSLFSEVSLIAPLAPSAPALNYVIFPRGGLITLPKSIHLYVVSGDIQYEQEYLSAKDIRFTTKATVMEVKSEVGKCFLLKAF